MYVHAHTHTHMQKESQPVSHDHMQIAEQGKVLLVLHTIIFLDHGFCIHFSCTEKIGDATKHF